MEYLAVNPITVYSDSLYSVASFISTFSAICLPGEQGKDLPEGEHRLSKRDCEVLLKWLNRDCGVIVTDGEVRFFLVDDEHSPTILGAWIVALKDESADNRWSRF
jgi:charged multivesicular body protein 7